MDEPLKNRLNEEENGIAVFEPLSAKYKITFEAIGGLEELKKQASIKIIQPFKNPELFKKFKISKLRNTVLLFGYDGDDFIMDRQTLRIELNNKIL